MGDLTQGVCFKCKTKFKGSDNICTDDKGNPMCPKCGHELFEIIRN